MKAYLVDSKGAKYRLIFLRQTLLYQTNIFIWNESFVSWKMSENGVLSVSRWQHHVSGTCGSSSFQTERTTEKCMVACIVSMQDSMHDIDQLLSDLPGLLISEQLSEVSDIWQLSIGEQSRHPYKLLRKSNSTIQFCFHLERNFRRETSSNWGILASHFRVQITDFECVHLSNLTVSNPSVVLGDFVSLYKIRFFFNRRKERPMVVKCYSEYL